MCLTIPARIIKLAKNQAWVQDSNSIKKISILLVPDLKIGDWVLYINETALQKISSIDAKEIIELLKNSKKVDLNKLNKKFKNLISASKFRDLNKKEITYLLQAKGKEKEALLAEANIVRQNNLKDFICIHGIIEFSNFCKNDCFYCGLRAQNKKIKRYRMSVEEIVKTAVNAVNKKGYKLLVLQSGEDSFYSDKTLCQIIKEVKKRAKVFIIMSVGERNYLSFQKMKEAGAAGVLLRFETSKQRLFKKLHPRGKNLKNRLDHLKFLKKLGYFIATGFMVGLPGQTIADLADDILLAKKSGQMISLGPFVPCDQTPLVDSPRGDIELSLKIIAILRLLMRRARIPVVTALETIAGEEGRKKALGSGANSLMINLTPAKYRPLYKIYPDKFYQNKNLWEKYGLFKYEESYKMLEERMQEALTNKGL